MAEQKPPVVQQPTELERLRAENASLRSQLAAAGGRVQQPEHVFQLSEGDRQELEIRGVINVGGRMLTKDDVKAMLGKDQRDVKIADAPDGTRVSDVTIAQAKAREGDGVRGVDFVWPSVAPGKIDPAVAGTPGISGPSA